MRPARTWICVCLLAVSPTQTIDRDCTVHRIGLIEPDHTTAPSTPIASRADGQGVNKTAKRADDAK